MSLYNNLIALYKPLPYPTIYSHPFKPIRSLRISASSESTRSLQLAHSVQSETLQILEWPAVCAQLVPFTSTSMGLSAAQSAGIPLGQSPEESKTLLAQTSAAVAVPRPLDFSGIEDVSAIVDSAVAGNLLTIQELCLFKGTLRSVRHLVEQLEEFLADEYLSERYLYLFIQYEA